MQEKIIIIIIGIGSMQEFCVTADAGHNCTMQHHSLHRAVIWRDGVKANSQGS